MINEITFKLIQDKWDVVVHATWEFEGETCRLQSKSLEFTPHTSVMVLVRNTIHDILGIIRRDAEITDGCQIQLIHENQESCYTMPYFKFKEIFGEV